MQFTRLFYYLAATALVAATADSEAARLGRPVNPAHEAIKREVRILEDVLWIGTRLNNGELTGKLQPALIQGNGAVYEHLLAEHGFAADPDSAATMYAIGEVILLDPTNLKDPLRTVRYCEPLRHMQRGTSELGRVFSPYRTKDNLVLCEQFEVLKDSKLANFPRTYLLPAGWFSEVFRLEGVTEPILDGMLSSKSSSSPLETCLLALVLNGTASGQKLNDQLVPLLQTGDVYSKALVASLILSRGGPEGMMGLSDYVGGAKDSQQVYAVALAVAALQLRGDSAVQDSSVLKQAVAAFCDKNPEGVDRIKEILHWLDHP